MSKNSTSISSSINNEFNLDVSGTMRGSTIESSASIDINSLSQSNINMKMVEEVINKLTNELNKKKTDFPAFGNMDTQSIKNIVKNNVTAKLSSESLITSNMSINQRATINVQNTGNMINSRIIITSAGTMALVNGMSSSIMKDLGVKNESDNKGTQTTTAFIADIITSVTDGVANIAGTIGDIFGFSPQMVALFLAVVIVPVTIVTNGQKF